MAQDANDNVQSPFEGPEKLLEIWFAPSAREVEGILPSFGAQHRSGLRTVNRDIWEEMLDIVKCKVLNVIEGNEMDAYLLSESSLLIYPHKLILKTCGTTLNLLGLPRILEIAHEHASLPIVYRCFYSRKTFMFPERQKGPHREWKDEVKFLDTIFRTGAAYSVGKINGDHWLLYMTSPWDDGYESAPSSPLRQHHAPYGPDSPGGNSTEGIPLVEQACTQEPMLDYTIEILMTKLAPSASQAFFANTETADNPSLCGQKLSEELGISDLFPPQLTTLDAYAFEPCGYSSNAIITWGSTAPDLPTPDAPGGEGYYTIHVTPEAGWSYASFECNVPLPTHPSPHPTDIPDLRTLIRRVVNIFKPGHITLTLFISAEENDSDNSERQVEAAQRAFKAALTQSTGLWGEGAKSGLYKRTDKINYELGGYDLAFASFELRR